MSVAWTLTADRIGLNGTRFVGARKTALGHAINISLRAPTTARSVEAAAEQIAVAFRAARIRVVTDDRRADLVTVMLDDELGIGLIPYEEESNPVGLPLDPRRPIPLGRDDDGLLLCGRFYGQHALIGGNPGSGKSNALRVILAGLVASRNLRLVGIDPKHAELSMWRDRFDQLILGNEPEPAIELLSHLLDEVQRRAQMMAEMRTATLLPAFDHPWIVLAVDEWAELGAAGDTKQRNQIAGLLRRYLSLGRAVGCTAVLCTQRPTSDAIDVGARALITHRFALKCGDRHQAEAILGVGSFAPDQLRSSLPGRALWSDGGPARPVQFFEVADPLVPDLVMAGLRGV